MTHYNELGMVTITKQEYDRLKANENFLLALEAMGVDNWEGYAAACRIADGEDVDG